MSMESQQEVTKDRKPREKGEYEKKKFISSVLCEPFVQQSRPMSQHELADMRQTLIKRLKLSDVMTEHSKCGHSYRVKKEGKKEKEILDSKNPDNGNCSVCWRIHNTDFSQKNIAKKMSDEYTYRFIQNKPTFLDYEDVDLEILYYRWLYEQI